MEGKQERAMTQRLSTPLCPFSAPITKRGKGKTDRWTARTKNIVTKEIHGANKYGGKGERDGVRGKGLKKKI